MTPSLFRRSALSRVALLGIALTSAAVQAREPSAAQSTPTLDAVDEQVREVATALLNDVESRLRGCTNYRDVLRITLRIEGGVSAQEAIARHAPRRCALFVADPANAEQGPRRVAVYFPSAAMIFSGGTLTIADRTRTREHPAGRFRVLTMTGGLSLTQAYESLPRGNEGLEHPLLGTLLRRAGDTETGKRWLFAPFGRVDSITRREINGRPLVTLAGTTRTGAIQGGDAGPASAIELDIDEATGLPRELRIDATAQVRTMLLAMAPANGTSKAAPDLTRAWQVFTFEDQAMSEPQSPALEERFTFRPPAGMKRVESLREQIAPAPDTAPAKK